MYKNYILYILYILVLILVLFLVIDKIKINEIIENKEIRENFGIKNIKNNIEILNKQIEALDKDNLDIIDINKIFHDGEDDSI